MSEAKANPNPRVIWMAFLGATVVYVGLGLSGVIPPQASPGLPLFPVFAGVAAVMAVLATILRGRLVDSTPGSSSAERAVASNPESSSAERAAALQRAIVPWALDEGIAVLGYVLMMLGYRPIQWVPFCVVGLAMLLLHAPRSDR